MSEYPFTFGTVLIALLCSSTSMRGPDSYNISYFQATALYML